MNKNKLIIKKIEPLLSEKIKDIYQDQLEHELDNISLKLFDRILIITIEGIITSPEKLLKDNDRLDLARQVREAIEKLIQPQIQELIEEILNVKVVDFLSDTTLDSNMTGAIAIFEFKSKDILNKHKA